MSEKHSAQLSISRISSTPNHPKFGQNYIEIDAHWSDKEGKVHGATIRLNISDLGWAITGRMGIPCELEVV